MKKRKRVLITGSAGFIGFHLSLALKKRGDEVCGLDNFNDYYSLSLKNDRKKLLEKEGIYIAKADVTDQKSLEELFCAFNPTDVVHLAAQAGVRYSIKNPSSYIYSNVDAFLQLLEVMKKRPKTALVYASSSSVYGDNKKTPFSVDDRCDHPTNLYGATKKANEAMAYAYHNLYGIPMTGLRYFTAYGPWGRPDMAYYFFSDYIQMGKTIDLYNGGKMVRDFTYIDDIIAGTVAAIDHSSCFSLYNLGNNQPISIDYLVTQLEKLLNKKAKIAYKPKPACELEKTYADISLSEKELGYKPKTTFDEGITKFIQWYNSYHTL